MSTRSLVGPELTVGLDLGDRRSHVCCIDAGAVVVRRDIVRTSPDDVRRFFRQLPRSRVALEAGTHSPWMSHLLAELGHQVIVANPRRLRLISESERKCDRHDAESLARLARSDPSLLAPIRHRTPSHQRDLVFVRARHALVRGRTLLINYVRGAVKPFGLRIRSSTSDGFARAAQGTLPSDLEAVLSPILETVADLTRRIRDCDRKIEALSTDRHPETGLLRQVNGVGPITALTFLLTIEDPDRFKKSRDVASYLGLVRRRSDSGDHESELRITKAGDRMLRSLLVQCAQHILGPFGEDSDLRRWGLALASRGKRNAKKRSIIAVARKLAVLLHHLWRRAEVYEPLRQAVPPATPEAIAVAS